jgi:hypothetical protein
LGPGLCARPGPSARLSGSIGVMGYQIVTNTDGESLSDEGWMDLIALASKHGFSAPRLSHLGQYADTNLTEAEDSGLCAALERALFAGEPQEHITPEHDVLDRDTVRRVSHVLRGPGIKMLRRTPPIWR